MKSKNDVEEIILYDSDKAASLQTVTGWVSRDGQFCGNCEDMARRIGMTHQKCISCESIIARGKYRCDPCFEKQEIERYRNAEKKEWDGESLLFSDAEERYFQDMEELNDYCFDENKTKAELRIFICEPTSLKELDCDDWCDDLAEDQELPIEIVDAINVFNEAIKKYGKAVSWYPSKFALKLD